MCVCMCLCEREIEGEGERLRESFLEFSSCLCQTYNFFPLLPMSWGKELAMQSLTWLALFGFPFLVSLVYILVCSAPFPFISIFATFTFGYLWNASYCWVTVNTGKFWFCHWDWSFVHFNLFWFQFLLDKLIFGQNQTVIPCKDYTALQKILHIAFLLTQSHWRQFNKTRTHG